MTETRTPAHAADPAAGQPADGQPLSPRALRLVMLLLAFACGASVANLYYAQPLLGLIERSFGVTGGTESDDLTTNISSLASSSSSCAGALCVLYFSRPARYV